MWTVTWLAGRFAAFATAACTRAITCVPVHASAEVGVMCTVQFNGSMRRVREQRHLVLGGHDIAFAEDVVDAAHFLGDSAVALARAAQP